MEFSQVVQKVADTTGKELTPTALWSTFQDEYLATKEPFALLEHRDNPSGMILDKLTATVLENGKERIIAGSGNGPIDAFVDAMSHHCSLTIRVADYHEHAIGAGADARAVAYVEIQVADKPTLFGVGIHENIVTASLRAVVSALNRAVAQGVNLDQEKHSDEVRAVMGG
jgi:2-isopropylmalate synthase